MTVRRRCFFPASAGLGGYSPYQMVITRAATGGLPTTTPAPVSNYLQTTHGNVTGEALDPTAATPFQPDITITFDQFTGVTTNANQQKVAPNNGQYTTAAANGETPGMVVIGQSLAGDNLNKYEFNPNTKNAPWNGPGFLTTTNPPSQSPSFTTPPTAANAGGTPSNAMAYTIPLPKSTDLEGENLGLRRHVVMLRRLANPYQKFDKSTNPWITVDYQDWVPAYDAVRWASDTDMLTKMDRTPKMSVGGTGIDKGVTPPMVPLPVSIGKVQPYASFATGTPVAGAGTATTINSFPASFGLGQAPTTAPAEQVNHTFFRQNGVSSTAPVASALTLGVNGSSPTPTMLGTKTAPETIMTPFDWLVHLDRPLISQAELLHVQAVKPHEVTQYFLQPPVTAANGDQVRKDMGVIPWLGVDTNNANATFGQPPLYDSLSGRPLFNYSSANNPSALTGNGMFRALEVLRVKPWVYGTPSGGRVAGKVNIGTTQDPRIMQAILDPQNNSFNATNIDNLWVPTSQQTVLQSTPFSGLFTGPGGRTANTTPKALATGAIFQMPTLSQNTPVPVPGPTIDDLGSNNNNPDRPFKPFGVGQFTSGGQVMQAGSGIQDTILRTPQYTAWTANTPYNAGDMRTSFGGIYLCTTAGLSAPMTGPSGTGNSITDNKAVWSYVGQPGVPTLWVQGQSQPYLQTEMLRKMMNNTTTVSNTFAVHLTVVFYNVRPTGPQTDNGTIPRTLLGSEAFGTTPGDYRQQFFAIIDRTNMTLQAGGSTIQTTPFTAALTQPPTPNLNAAKTAVVSTTLTLANVFQDPANSNAWTIMRDSQKIPLVSTLTSNPTLLLGTGANQETVTVTSVNPANGTLTVTPLPLGTAPNVGQLSKTHYAGEAVTNATPGYSGPQSSFDGWSNPNSSFRSVVPYISKIQ